MAFLSSCLWKAMQTHRIFSAHDVHLSLFHGPLFPQTFSHFIHTPAVVHLLWGTFLIKLSEINSPFLPGQSLFNFSIYLAFFFFHNTFQSWIHTHTHTHTHTCVCDTCMHVYICIATHICVCVCVCVPISSIKYQLSLKTGIGPVFLIAICILVGYFSYGTVLC